MTESLRGRLLVATPALLDPHFVRTVVLVLEHTAEGAVGVVLNRPSVTALADALPDWAPYATVPGVVFVGGPVGAGSAICLASARPGAEPLGWQPVAGRLGVVDLALGPEVLAADLDGVRVFSGYAGWGARQLDDEVTDDGWFVVDADPLDALDPEPERLWRGVLRREGGRLARYASFPEDATLN